MDKSKDAPRHMDEADFLPPTVPGANNGAMKLLAFWPDLAEVWFTQADTQFAIKAVTVSKRKFYHAVAVLPQEVAAQIFDLIRAPSARTAYKVLKDRLITLYSLNNYQRFEALVSLPFSSETRNPVISSQMIINNIFFLRGLFLSRLPTEVCSNLLQEKISNPQALALKADDLFQSRISSPVNLPDDSTQVNAVVSRSRPRSLARRSSTSASSAKTPPSPDLC